MLLLPNNCRAGNLTVYPKNWKTVKANAKLIWSISYRFYDDNLKQCRKVVIKGMNRYDLLHEKQAAVHALMADELRMLKDEGLNRITGIFKLEKENDVTTYTPFIEALNYAFEHIKVSAAYKIDIKSCLKYITLAAMELYFDRYPLRDIRRKQLLLLLEKTGEIKKAELEKKRKANTKKILPEAWSANTFNYYRSSLGVLYKYLISMEAVDSNVALSIEKEAKIKKIRDTLTKDQRTAVNGHIYKLDYHFWRFMQVFFHSGSRIIEMLAVKKKDVDMDNQRFKVTVKKGKKHQEEWRPIKSIALTLWLELSGEASDNDYLFSLSLRPGIKLIRREQVTRRWRRHVKKKLGITADFYSLKHSNLDDIARIAGMETAQKAAGHTTPVITLKYATGEQERQHERIRGVDNAFS